MTDHLDLSPFFKTKLEANTFATRLSTISEKMYQTHFNLEAALGEQLGMRKKDLFLTLLQENTIPTDNNSSLKAFLDKLQQSISSLPVLSLTVAFEPTEQTLQVLSDWFMLNIHTQVLFDLSVDAKLIAGTTLNFNGKYLDLSVKAKFEQILKDIMNKVQATLNGTPPPAPVDSQHQTAAHMHLGR